MSTLTNSQFHYQESRDETPVVLRYIFQIVRHLTKNIFKSKHWYLISHLDIYFGIITNLTGYLSFRHVYPFLSSTVVNFIGEYFSSKTLLTMSFHPQYITSSINLLRTTLPSVSDLSYSYRSPLPSLETHDN